MSKLSTNKSVVAELVCVLYICSRSCYNSDCILLSYAYSSLPSSLLCRDEQLSTIRQWVGERVKEEGKGGALYISGAPGTGKTACVTHLIEEMKVIPQTVCVGGWMCVCVGQWVGG